MKRFLLALVTGVVLAPAVGAQDAPQATEVYVAYYKISFADMSQWIADYHEHSTPVLQDLVDEGVILGFGAHMHHTGGEYNIRQSILGNEETNFDAFWEAYLSRLIENDPTAFERGNRMIQAHADEIWELQEVNTGDGGPARWFYDAHFQINFADLEEWNRLWDEAIGPVLEQAMADGLVAGWVEEGHNTGGRFNWKLITFYDEWDHIDDVIARFYEAVPPGDPLWGMIMAHNDVLWEVVPPPEG
jgi:hypothetical protein